MAYQGTGSHSPPQYDDNGHRLQDLPHGSYEEEASRGLLSHQQGPFTGPFDDPQQHGSSTTRPVSGYSLSETYAPEAAYHDPYTQPSPGSVYSAQSAENPAAAFGVPGRVASPYARSDTSSTEAWRQRQAPGGGPGGLRRYATRKVKLVQGSVLSVDYPVPSAIQNAIQAKYRNDLEGGSEEFTHMRCE
jgi:chitin synthase